MLRMGHLHTKSMQLGAFVADKQILILGAILYINVIEYEGSN